MKWASRMLALLFLVAGAMKAAGQPLFTITEVAPGVYSAISERVAANATIIVNAQDVIVVDTHFSPAAAREVIAHIKKLTPKPVRYVINTHRHGDHSNGNQAYVAAFPNVEIIAHVNTRTDIEQLSLPAHRKTLETLPQTLQELAAEEKQLQSGRDENGKSLTSAEVETRRHELARKRAYYEGQRELQITLPTQTFERKLTLQRGDRVIELLYFGRAHTRGDAVVWLPREKVVITGDLLADKLWVGGGYPLEYLDVLRQLAQLDFTRVIPGHGPVLQGKAHLERITQLLTSLITQTRHAVQQGLSLEEAKKRVDLRGFGDLITEWNINDGIERAYAEIKPQSALSDEAAIRQTLQRYLQAHITGDPAHLQKAFHSEAKLLFVRDGKLAQMTMEEYAKRFSGKPAEDEASRKRTIETIELDGNAAMARIKFDSPTTFTTDFILLLKLDGEWKIVQKSFYVRQKAKP